MAYVIGGPKIKAICKLRNLIKMNKISSQRPPYKDKRAKKSLNSIKR